MNLYDINRDFFENFTSSLFLTAKLPLLENGNKKIEAQLFGYPIASRIGIPACAIMTSQGIRWASKAGFDVLTYKTIRSTPHTAHPLPNIVFVEVEGIEGRVQREDSYERRDQITIANSLGIPSFSLESTLQDIALARASLSKGQVLIVSILGTCEEDFAFLAKKAVEAGAHIIEANLSCPNLHHSREILPYKDPEQVFAIVQSICRAVPEIPVVIKVGLFDSLHQMKEVFITLAQAGGNGICGINSIPKKILDQNNIPAFGKSRLVAGVTGNYLRIFARQFIQDARHIIKTDRLNLTLLATGGVMLPEHFDLYLQDGADIVMSATGVMWNPFLAIHYH